MTQHSHRLIARRGPRRRILKVAESDQVGQSIAIYIRGLQLNHARLEKLMLHGLEAAISDAGQHA